MVNFDKRFFLPHELYDHEQLEIQKGIVKADFGWFRAWQDRFWLVREQEVFIKLESIYGTGLLANKSEVK
jgi:hypothetical protein